MLIVALFVLMYAFSHWGMSRQNALAAILANCERNAPYAAGWAEELKAAGYHGTPAAAVKPYCRCTLMPVFQGMSRQELSEFAKLSPAAQTERMGGREAITKRHQSCLKAVAANE